MAYDQDQDGPDTQGNGNDPTNPPTNHNTEAPIEPNALYNAVQSIYKNALGREGSSQEINGWINNANVHHNIGEIQTAIYNSQEAKDYAANQYKQSQANKPSAQDYIRQWQQSHPGVNLQELLDNMKTLGYNVSPYMYGTTASKNEILLDGQKFKVISGENGPNPAWYMGGDDSGGQNALIGNGPSTANSLEDYYQKLYDQFNTNKSDQDKANEQSMTDLIKQLTDRSNQSLNIDPQTDPIIKGQTDAARVAQERQRTNYLNDLSESSNPYTTGNLATARLQSAEDVGTNISNLQSTLMQNELTARRGEIAQALQEKGGLLTSAQQTALQRQLGLIDSALKNRGLDMSNDQFLRNLMLQRMFLDSQNDQFAANYDMNSTNLANYWDWVRTHGHGPSS